MDTFVTSPGTSLVSGNLGSGTRLELFQPPVANGFGRGLVAGR